MRPVGAATRAKIARSMLGHEVSAEARARMSAVQRARRAQRAAANSKPLNAAAAPVSPLPWSSHMPVRGPSACLLAQHPSFYEPGLLS